MKVLVTGSRGTIGSVLTRGFTHHMTPYDLTPFDLPEHDVGDYEQLLRCARAHDAIVHLAWESSTDNYIAGGLNPDNVTNTFHVYRAAVEAGVPRVVMASSVHADRFTDRQLTDLLHPSAVPRPDSPYGASKVMMEALGRTYADAYGLEVVCIRFGGVNPDNVPPASPESERRVWLSHRDCTRLVRACLEADHVPDGCAVVYGVSDNPGRLHDLANPFGWVPLDGATAD